MNMPDILRPLTEEDRALAWGFIGPWRDPDVTLAPDGEPYLFRWHLHYDNEHGNVFFHIQVKSDPERPLHDHPWNNMSVILAGGYDELYEPFPSNSGGRAPLWRKLRVGDSVFRTAETAHRLILPPDIPYVITLFTTGPKRREWGFWYPDGFHHNKRHTDDRAGAAGMVSIGHHEEKSDAM